LHERRRLWRDLGNADYVRETLAIPDCKIVVCIDRQLTTDDGNAVLSDRRYFVTSLDPETVIAHDIIKHVRNHWRIENCLDFTKDRWWDEDRHHTRRPGLSAINNAALFIHRIKSDDSIPLRASADYVQWLPDIGIKMLAK